MSHVEPQTTSAGTKCKSQVIVLQIHKVSETFGKANLRLKEKFLGLRLAFMNV